MGGNGSFSIGMYDSESERHYRTEYSPSKNIKVIRLKKAGSHDKMPRTSHTANRVYVTMRKDGSDISEIARFGKNHKKLWSIHTKEHRDKRGHYTNGHIHFWKDGKPTKFPEDINKHPRLKRLLDKVRKMKR